MTLPLVRINDSLMLRVDQILSATRCGNYTNVTRVDGSLLQVWDEHEDLWERLKVAADRFAERG